MSTPVFPRPHPWRVVLWFLLALLAVIAALQLCSCAAMEPNTAAAIGSAAGAGLLAWSTGLLEAGIITPEQHQVFMAGLGGLADEIETAKMIGYAGGGLGAAVGAKPTGRVVANVAGAVLRSLRKPAGARPPAG